jgi:hypothetical protein
MQYINTLCGRNAEILNVKECSTYNLLMCFKDLLTSFIREMTTACFILKTTIHTLELSKHLQQQISLVNQVIFVIRNEVENRALVDFNVLVPCARDRLS